MRQLIITDGDNTFFTNNKFLVNDGIPTSGYFNKGDVIINTGSLAGTEPLYVCYKSGSPGSWGKLKFDNEYLTREEVIELILENATEDIDVSHLALKSEVNAKDAEHDLAIENIQKSIKVLEGLVDSAGDVDVSKLALKSDMNAKDKELEEDIKLLKSNDVEIVERLTNAQEAIQNIQYQNIDYTTDITSLKAADVEFIKTISEVKKDIQNIENQDFAFKSDIENLEGSIDDIHDSIEILEGLVDSAGDIDLTHLALKSDVETKDTELENNIKTLQQADEGLNNKIIIANENMSLLNTRISQIAENVYNKSEVDTAIAKLVDGAPDAMNTLNELAKAINDNKDIYDDYVDTISSTIAGKADKEHGTHLELGNTSSTAFRGDHGNTAYTHSQAAHAPSNAQKNSDITKAEIEAKLTGSISSHSHSYLPTSGGTLTGSLKVNGELASATGIFTYDKEIGLADSEGKTFIACLRHSDNRGILDLGTNAIPGRIYVRSGQGTTGSGVYIENRVTDGKAYVQYLPPEAGTIALTTHLSDRTKKDDIVYINSEESELSNKDFYDFIKDDLGLATYTLKDAYSSTDTHTKLNFIAQDILWDFNKNEENKVGNIIVQADAAMKEQGSLKYDPDNFTSVIAGALQEAIKKIEDLEARIKELESK